MLLVYVWWLMTTPYHRFEVLESLHFERLIVVALGIAWLATRAPQRRYHGVAVALAALVLVMLLSYLFSSHQNDRQAATWADEYWKELVLFVFLGYGVSRSEQLGVFLVGTAGISLAYQGYSLLDFLSGGSYVYQQGLRRMVGVWSGGGLGSANEWGSFALYSLPLGVYWYNRAWNRRHRYAAVALLGVSAASVVFSGTRAAFVVSMLFIIVQWRRHILRPGRLVLLAAAIAITWTQMPQEYRARIELIWRNSDSAQLTQTEQVAVDSGKARIMGLQDGWSLFLDRPLLGYGPGSSQLARAKLHPTTPPDELEQLHSLYGQLLSEVGALGAIAFLWLLRAILRATRPQAAADAAGALRRDITVCTRWLMVLLLAYGLFTHSLYQYYWLLVAGLASAYATSALDGAPGQAGSVRARRRPAPPAGAKPA